MISVSVILLYALYFLSFFAVYTTFREESKVALVTSVVVYAASGVLSTFLLINNWIAPAEGANIGLGLAMMLMVFISLFGLIIAGTLHLIEHFSDHSSRQEKKRTSKP